VLAGGNEAVDLEEHTSCGLFFVSEKKEKEH